MGYTLFIGTWADRHADTSELRGHSCIHRLHTWVGTETKSERLTDLTQRGTQR